MSTNAKRFSRRPAIDLIVSAERYAKLGKAHLARTGETASGMWQLMSGVKEEQTTASV